jgi:hypothetical protein
MIMHFRLGKVVNRSEGRLIKMRKKKPNKFAVENMRKMVTQMMGYLAAMIGYLAAMMGYLAAMIGYLAAPHTRMVNNPKKSLIAVQLKNWIEVPTSLKVVSIKGTNRRLTTLRKFIVASTKREFMATPRSSLIVGRKNRQVKCILQKMNLKSAMKRKRQVRILNLNSVHRLVEVSRHPIRLC